MSTLLINPLNVPLALHAAWSNGSTQVSPGTSDFTQLANAVPSSGSSFSNASPWLGETVRPSLQSTYTLDPGLHLHWTLPAALRRGTSTYVLDYEVYNELVQQGVPCSLVAALEQAAGFGVERTRKELHDLLASLVPSSTFEPLASQAFALRPENAPKTYTYPQGLISPDQAISVSTYQPDLTWDPIFLELYGPLIIQAAAQMKLPPVPNRWLVVRQGGDTTAAWVIESDALSVSGTSDAGPTAVPARFPADFVTAQDSVSKSATHELLGLVNDATTWSETERKRLTPLTAVGTGNPEFSAFYRNCRGVFGFFDGNADQNTTYVYTVIGWFSSSADDPLSSEYAVLPWADGSKVSDRLTQLKWLLPAGSDLSSIDGSIYVGQLAGTPSDCVLSGPGKLSGVTVAVGNTAGEALAADLAQGSSSALGLSAETLLNAAQAGILSKALEPDGPAQVNYDLHQQSYRPLPGGYLWDIVPKQKRSKFAPEVKLSKRIEHHLSRLNELQAQFDRTQHYIRTQRELLFTDWCRALHLQTDYANSGFPNGNTQVNQGPLGIVNVALPTIGVMYSAVDQAGPGAGKGEYMLAYNAAEALYLAHAALRRELQSIDTSHRLKRIPAPRYWEPNDPTVLMSSSSEGSLLMPTSDNLPALVAQENALWLPCSLATPTSNYPSYINPTWTSGPSPKCIKALVDNYEYQCSMSSSWRPLVLEWETYFYPYVGAGAIEPEGPETPPFSVKPYSSSFISDNFSPNAAGVELTVTNSATIDSSNPAVYNGRAVLSNHAFSTMQNNILRLAGLDVNDPPATLTPTDLPPVYSVGNAATLMCSAYNSSQATLSQALDGFTRRLLMLRNIPQVSLFDPNYAAWLTGEGYGTKHPWDENSQSFYLEIGRQCRFSPDQLNHYNPIRAGRCEVRTLKLVDAFGQIQKWSLSAKNCSISEYLPHSSYKAGDLVPTFDLPPRLAQAARVQFRWVGATRSDQPQDTPEPELSPIVGWTAIDRIDQRILIFNTDGAMLGWVASATGAFTPAPGSAPPQSTHHLLTDYIEYIKSNSVAVFNGIADALLTIEPVAHRQHTARSVLVSRPLALVRAELNLELLGVPAPHQGFEWLAVAELDPNFVPVTHKENQAAYSPVDNCITPFVLRETCGFTGVEFPVWLGNVNLDNDGVVAYWNLCRSGGRLSFNGNWNLVDAENVPGISLSCAPGTPATEVLLMVDPRAPAHVFSGILPVKALTIPPAMYTDALKRMQYYLDVGPLLSQPDNILLPIPTEVSSGWNWVYKGTSGLVQVAQGAAAANGQPGFSGKVDDRAHQRDQPAALHSGWLQTKLT